MASHFLWAFLVGGHSTRGERLTLNWGLRMLGLRDEIKMKLLIRMKIMILILLLLE